MGGSTPISLHFNAGSREHAEDIVYKLKSSKSLAAPRPSVSSQPEDLHSASPPPAIRTDLHKSPKNGASVRFAVTSPTVIPPRSPSEEEYIDPDPEPELEDERTVGHNGGEETADALYDFDADGDDELSVKEGEHLVVVERDGDEWWKCRNSHGVEGVVPASYLEVSQTLNSP